MPNIYGLMNCSAGELPKDEKQKIVFTTRFERNARASYDSKMAKWIIQGHGIESDDVKVIYWIPENE
jgi:hypothetical protein